MKHSVANLARALAVVLLFLPGPVSIVNQAPALAAPTETLAAEPAVILPEESVEEEQDPWTARFLAPAVVVLSVVAVGASISYYIVRVRGRYRVAE